MRITGPEDRVALRQVCRSGFLTQAPERLRYSLGDVNNCCEWRDCCRCAAAVLAMTDPVLSNPTPESPATATPSPAEPPPSYVKLAMRNMVRKRGKALTHFFLSTIAMVTLLIGLAYFTR